MHRLRGSLEAHVAYGGRLTGSTARHRKADKYNSAVGMTANGNEE